MLRRAKLHFPPTPLPSQHSPSVIRSTSVAERMNLDKIGNKLVLEFSEAEF